MQKVPNFILLKTPTESSCKIPNLLFSLFSAVLRICHLFACCSLSHDEKKGPYALKCHNNLVLKSLNFPYK